MGKGKPRVYVGCAVGFRLSAILRIQLHAAAQAQGRSVSDLVRAAVEEKYGAGAKEGQVETRGE